MILINFVGWTVYYLGYQYGWLIMISQFTEDCKCSTSMNVRIDVTELV